MSVLRLRVISRGSYQRRCLLSHVMSFSICLMLVSFFAGAPRPTLRRPRLCSRNGKAARPFRHCDDARGRGPNSVDYGEKYCLATVPTALTRESRADRITLAPHNARRAWHRDSLARRDDQGLVSVTPAPTYWASRVCNGRFGPIGTVAEWRFSAGGQRDSAYAGRLSSSSGSRSDDGRTNLS